MACVAVVALDGDGVRLADDVAFGRQDFGKSVPVIRVKGAKGQVFDLVVEPLEGGSITIAENPGHSSPCATIHRFDKPDFVFFDPMKCHISSNSISVILPETGGTAIFAASSLIQR